MGNAIDKTNSDMPLLDDQTPRPGHPPGSVVRVAFDTPMERFFDYRLPDEWIGKVAAGQRVEVPFGRSNRPAVGFVVAVPDEATLPRLKTVLAPVDEEPLLDGRLMELARWISDYYASPLGRTLAVMVPAAVKRQVGMATRTRVHLAVAAAEAAGVVASLRLKQAKVAQTLADAGAFDPDSAVEIDELAGRVGCTRGPIQALLDKGVAAAVQEEYIPGQTPPPARLTEPAFELNRWQQAALERLGPRVSEGGFSVTLLHGVTSSGKTEIYLRLIRRALAAGRSALVLIPEIALTTQAVDRYRRRLGSVAVIHSGLTDTQRSLAWARIARGDYQVVLGTISAVFAPLRKLGLVIVDEEQESSFKHLKSPRYHARDTAIQRARLCGIPAVLGSATPSLETWFAAQHAKHFDYIELPQRVAEVPMPKIRVVDMRAEQRDRRGIHLLSRLLEQQITWALGQKKQVVLLLNRRGYASYVFCASCKFALSCDRCNVNLTYHKATDTGLCHQCGQRKAVPEKCPVCGSKIVRFGLGTQRIEEEIERKFPGVRLARVDSDTMKRAGDYERVLGAFERGEIDVMLGTQMIAKGLDFPDVTLVGVVSADTTLAIPDFRASERTFQLISQVAGRAGRAHGQGRVVIQTLHPELPAIDYAVRHDYRGFADSELPNRKDLGFPPFGRLALFVLRHREEPRAHEAGRALADGIEALRIETGVGGRVRGPMVAPIARIRDQCRIHLLLQAESAEGLQRWLAEARRRGLLDRIKVEWIVDVDPLALM
ncbi:MAG: Primosomal protein N' [Phycisphaerae bacterium]|nr:Primosomal protein N' [Phycisphaerae bacterium]